MWAIVGRCGLYAGTWLTRKDAIKQHCIRKGDYWNDEIIKMVWNDCKKVGDKAVKVEVKYES